MNDKVIEMNIHIMTNFLEEENVSEKDFVWIHHVCPDYRFGSRL
jgi:hypothetical protein